MRALRTFFQNVHCTSQQIAVTLLRWLSQSPSGSTESLPGPPPSLATKFTPGHLEGPLRPCSNSEDGISTGEMVLVAFGSILHIMCVCVCVCVCVYVCVWRREWLFPSCLENSMDRGAWWATVCGITKSDTTEVT